jgi:lipoprotein signal peptidase
MRGSSSLWVNVFHLAVVFPVLLYVGYKQKESTALSFNALTMLAFGAFGYNLYDLIVAMYTVTGGRTIDPASKLKLTLP